VPKLPHFNRKLPFNHRIQVFTPFGILIRKWGSLGTGAGLGTFIFPRGVAVDQNSGDVYVTDGTTLIQKFDSNGFFLTQWPVSGSFAVAVDASGNVYVADFSNHRIQKFSSIGIFITRWGTEGTDDGQFNRPAGIAVDQSSGNVYVAELNNHRIQKFDSNGNFLLKWGSLGTDDGQFTSPKGVAVDASGDVYVSDTANHRIQKFDSNNFLTKWGSSGTVDGQFDRPFGVAVDSDENVYVSDTENHRIQKFGFNIRDAVFTNVGVGIDFTFSGTNLTGLTQSYAWKLESNPTPSCGPAQISLENSGQTSIKRWTLTTSTLNEGDVNPEERTIRLLAAEGTITCPTTSEVKKIEAQPTCDVITCTITNCVEVPGSHMDITFTGCPLNSEIVIAIFTDDDNDGVLDKNDNCVGVPNPDQADNDQDGLGDVCDPDDDNDGVLDANDNCPFDANADQADFDFDVLGDVCDPDDDNDGVLDANDNCPFDANADQVDFDSDGLGDVCDDDVDGDGIANSADQCAFSITDNFLLEAAAAEEEFALKSNQYGQNGSFGSFEVGPNNDQSIVYDMDVTHGCTCQQIVELLGIGEGHERKGCSPGVMQKFTGVSHDPDREAGIGRK